MRTSWGRMCVPEKRAVIGRHTDGVTNSREVCRFSTHSDSEKEI
jgi:hypothetical protein